MEPSAPEEIWAEQVELWSDEGFHVESIIKKLSDETLDKSTTFLDAENQIKEAKSLQKELNKLTSIKEKEDWMEKHGHLKTSMPLLSNGEIGAA